MAENTIKTTDLARIKEMDVAELFGFSFKKTLEALGVTRKIKKEAGYALKTYKATGTLEDGNVAEGETIPLSKYTTEAVTYKELTLQKFRKATTAEAIVERGYDQAVDMTSKEMLKDVQKRIRKGFFDFLATGTGKASGTTLQGALAQCWGQLQTLFEDDDIASVYFVNPLDIADYLASAAITTQNVFGMTYIEDFLGLGTVFMNASVPKGKVYATAKDNLIMYYVAVNGADLGNAFTFTSDESGYIGIHDTADYTNLTDEQTVVYGIEILAEKIDGVVVGSISGEA